MTGSVVKDGVSENIPHVFYDDSKLCTRQMYGIGVIWQHGPS